MLYIRIRNRNTISWHVGEPVPPFVAADVASVQADCDELAYIENEFTGIPRVKGKWVVRWYGDDARFIAGNLRGR